MSHDFPLTLGLADHIVLPIFIVGIVGVLILGWVVVATVGEVLQSRERETTTRELAAYIAEGSITPDVAERLINAQAKADLRSALAEKAAEGWISTEDVRTLLRDDSLPGAQPAHA